MTSLAVICMKRLVRSRFIYIWLIFVLVLYFTVTGFLSGLLSGNQSANSNSNVPDQLVTLKTQLKPSNISILIEFLNQNKLKDRIRMLEESLENSKKNAQELNELIKGVYNDLNETLVLREEGKKSEEAGIKLPVLVISCNRAKSVENHLKQLIKYRQGSEERFPIIVSQDCGDQETANMIDSFGSHLFASIKVSFIYLKK